MKIAIFGIKGQLGSDLQAALSEYEVVPVSHTDADITDESAVRSVVSGAVPHWVINAAAMTHVDRCETEFLMAFDVNAVGARNVARASHAIGARLIHISTDYVFDGHKRGSYVESDTPRPLNVYGMSKLAGEWLVADNCPLSYVLRTSGLYGPHVCRGKGSNFVETMLRLAVEKDRLRVVNDERLTPTYTVDLAAQICELIKKEPDPGIYHATNGGGCSWYEFARELFRLTNTETPIDPVGAADWGSATARPANSVLDNSRLRAAGCDMMPDWGDALARFVRQRKS